MAKLDKIGYGQLELNQVAFRRDGRIEAQCALDTTDFTASSPAENGMILAIDPVARKVTLPAADGSDELLALNYSAEHMYDERANSLKDFRLVPGEVYPRLGYLSVGDKFTTNTIDFTGTGTNAAALATFLGSNLSTTPVYAAPNSAGYWALTTTKPASGLTARVLKQTTMPDGQAAVKLQIIAE